MRSVLFPSQLFQDNTRQKNHENKFSLPKPLITKQVPKQVEQTLTLVETPIETLPKDQTDVTTTKKVKFEEKVFNEIKEYLKNNENSYSLQKNDLVNMINETLNEKHQQLKAQIESTVETKLDKIKQFNSNSYNYPPEHILMLSKALNQNNLNNLNPNTTQNHQPTILNTPKEIIIESREDKKQSVKKGKYYPLPSDLWNKLKESFPDLPDDLKGSAYIRDNTKYIKLKNSYIEVNETGIAKILSKKN